MSPNKHSNLNDEITQILQRSLGSDENPSLEDAIQVLSDKQTSRRRNSEKDLLNRIHPESLDKFKLEVAWQILVAPPFTRRRIYFEIEFQNPFEVHRVYVRESSNLLDILKCETLSFNDNWIIIPFLKKIILDFTVNANPPVPVPIHMFL